jgi:hypothetical protein
MMEAPGAIILRRRSSPINAAAIAMVSVFPSATGSSHASNSRVCLGSNMRKPNVARSARNCSRRVWWRAA